MEEEPGRLQETISLKVCRLKERAEDKTARPSPPALSRAISAADDISTAGYIPLHLSCTTSSTLPFSSALPTAFLRDFFTFSSTELSSRRYRTRSNALI